MTVRVLSLIPTPSPELVRAKVLFEQRKEFGSTPVASEGAAVEIYVEPPDRMPIFKNGRLRKRESF